MKRTVNMWVAMLVWVGLAGEARALTSDSGDNPYLVVTNRNVFDLKPMPRPEDMVQPPPPTPPSKITLQGIQVLWGKKQVLLKVVEPPVPGQPPKERAITMDEGERRGALEVVRIDPDAREVEFRDSGTPVTLKLTDFITKTAALAPGTVPQPGVPRPGMPVVPALQRPGMPTLPAPTPMPTAGVPTFGGSSPTLPNVPTRPLRTTPNAAGGMAFSGGTPAGANTPPQTPPQVHLTPEEQMIIMEVERERTKQAVAAGVVPPLPPTAITPPESMPPMTPPTPPPLPGN